MKILKYGVLLALVFLVSVYSAFVFEDKYEELIRYLFECLTSNNISFDHLRKYIHFASGQFVLSFGFFMAALLFLLSRQNKQQIIKNLVAATLLLTTSTIVFCYIDGIAKLAVCTICENGKRELSYYDINYDGIFILSLALAFLPSLLTELKNRKRHRDKAL